jgi:DNA-binding transcriptional LysR family regulator
VAVGACRLAALVRDDHPFARRDSVDLAELAAEPLIVWGRAVNPALYDEFASAMDATGAPWALVGTAAGAVEVAARVMSGFGVGVVLEPVAQAHRIDGVRAVTVRDGPVVSRTLVWRRDDRSELLGAFVAAMRRRAAQPSRGSRNDDR